MPALPRLRGIEKLYVLSVSDDCGVTYEVTLVAARKQTVQTEVDLLRKETKASDGPCLRWVVEFDGETVEEFRCPAHGGILKAMGL